MSDRHSSQGASPMYQFRPDMGYPIYLQIVDVELEKELQYLIHESGFTVSQKTTTESLANSKKHRILRISAASPKVLKRITSYSQHAFGLGQELVENFGYYEVYVMMQYSMMIMSQSSSLWEMAFNKEKVQNLAKNDDARKNIRLALNRFLSSALAFHDVMAFWGALKDRQWVVAPMSQAQGQCVFVDLSSKAVFSDAKENALIAECKIHLIGERDSVAKEELYSLLATRSLYFSSGQIPKAFMLQMLMQLIPMINAVGSKSTAATLQV